MSDWVSLKNEKLLAGPWRSWTFGKDLRFIQGVTWVPTQTSTQGVAEEGVETLLMLNLGELFPLWGLRLCAKYIGSWAGADISATDIAGCQHVFEVKYGAPSGHVVDQAVSYALDLIRDRRLHWFDKQDATEREMVIARRIAAFWEGTRSDKWSQNTELAPNKRNIKVLQEHLEAAPLRDLFTYDELLVLARKWRDECLVLNGSPKTPDEVGNDLHIHLVLPDADKIDDAQVKALARLQYRGLRATIWEVSVQVKPETGRGDVAIREVRIRPLHPGNGKPVKIKPSRTVMDITIPVTGLVNLDGKPVVWRYGRDNTAGIGDHWYGSLPLLQVALHGQRVKIQVETVIQAFWKNDPEMKGQTAARYLTIREWVTKCAPPPSEKFGKVGSSWQAKCPKTGIVLDAKLSSGGQTASVEFDLSTDMMQAAKCCAQAIEQLIFVSRESQYQ